MSSTPKRGRGFNSRGRPSFRQVLPLPEQTLQGCLGLEQLPRDHSPMGAQSPVTACRPRDMQISHSGPRLQTPVSDSLCDTSAPPRGGPLARPGASICAEHLAKEGAALLPEPRRTGSRVRAQAAGGPSACSRLSSVPRTAASSHLLAG